ncbi:MAG TPA: hypothetical protein VLK83_09505 [Rhodanobacteraceae bacterium]|nr:hypothetical protein [Rhodanobacteraceae bacterium]
MMRCVPLVLVVLAVAGCSAPQAPMPITPSQDVATSPVVRQALPPKPVPSQTPESTTSASATAPAIVPAGTLYVCVVDSKGERQETAVEFAPKVAELCRKHPEMGVCQYEREVCRRHGGRVFASNGAEITRLTEVEYDKRVMRVRFRAD